VFRRTPGELLRNDIWKCNVSKKKRRLGVTVWERNLRSTGKPTGQIAGRKKAENILTYCGGARRGDGRARAGRECAVVRGPPITSRDETEKRVVETRHDDVKSGGREKHINNRNNALQCRYTSAGLYVQMNQGVINSSLTPCDKWIRHAESIRERRRPQQMSSKMLRGRKKRLEMNVNIENIRRAWM